MSKKGKIDIALIFIVVAVIAGAIGFSYFLKGVERADDETRRVAAEELKMRKAEEAVEALRLKPELILEP